MSKLTGVKIMEEVMRKLSSGKMISSQLSQAFNVAYTGCETDFSFIDFNDLQILNNEYNNQMKYQTSTVNSCGEINNAYESLYHLYSRLRLLAKRIIETNKGEDY